MPTTTTYPGDSDPDMDEALRRVRRQAAPVRPRPAALAGAR